MLRKNIPTIVIVLVVGVALFSISTALAVNGPAATKVNTEKTSAHLAMLKERLRLNETQTQKIKAILEESQKENMAMQGKSMSDPAAATKIREEHRKATDEKIKALLTVEQKKEYDMMNMESHQAMKEKMEHKTMEKMGPAKGNESTTEKSGGTGNYSGGK